MKKTMDQYRASWAWDQTKSVWDRCLSDSNGNVEKARKLFGDYVSLAEGMPATILQCGIGQTVAFYLAQNKDTHKALMCNLASWLCRDEEWQNATADEKQRKGGPILREDIITNDRDRYHAITEEALEYIVWLKRFGKAVKGS